MRHEGGGMNLLPDKNNRGAWLLICIVIAAIAGALMVHYGVVS